MIDLKGVPFVTVEISPLSKPDIVSEVPTLQYLGQRLIRRKVDCIGFFCLLAEIKIVLQKYYFCLGDNGEEIIITDRNYQTNISTYITDDKKKIVINPINGEFITLTEGDEGYNDANVQDEYNFWRNILSNWPLGDLEILEAALINLDGEKYKFYETF